LASTAAKPAAAEASNLRTIPVLAGAWKVVGGLSDHTKGIGVSVAAVAFGAAVLEKHVTLRRADGGVDSDFSLEPAELRSLVEESYAAWLALGEVHVGPRRGEAERQRLRGCMVVDEDVRAGDEITVANGRSIRPAGGLEPRGRDVVVGRTFSQDVSRGTPLSWDLV